MQRKLKNMGKKTENAFQAITIWNKEMCPSVFKLLQILATIPVSTASNLKSIKTYLRNSMTEVRINNQILCKIHQSKNILISGWTKRFGNDVDS